MVADTSSLPLESLRATAVAPCSSLEAEGLCLLRRGFQAGEAVPMHPLANLLATAMGVAVLTDLEVQGQVPSHRHLEAAAIQLKHQQTAPRARVSPP